MVNVIAINDMTPLTLIGADLSSITSFSSSPAADGPDGDLLAEGVDGSITIAAVDFGSSAANEGAGILARVTLRNVASGTSAITLTNVKLNKVGNVALTVNTVQNATAAGGVPCSGTTPTPTATTTPTPTPTPTPTVTPTVTPTPTS